MKKFTLTIISLALIFSSFKALANPIYEYKNSEKIYKGVEHTSIQRFYDSHSTKIDCLKVDLNEEHLKLELLKSSNGVDILETVPTLASKDNVIAATNLDFFSNHSGNKGFSLGLEIKDFNILQSPIDTSAMAGGFIEDNKLSLSYLTFKRTLTAPNSESIEIRHTNKHTNYYGDILLYTSVFNGGMSPAPGGEVVEVVVEDDKITEFRRNMPSVEIPENGYVLVTSEGMNMFLANNFKVGDEVKIDIDATPSLENVSTAFGGGTLLLKDGEKTPITHQVSGNNPRTAIGTDKTGKIIYLVTVDGRQTNSKGVSLDTLADIMIELGAYNAINADGGGSTNMVARTPFNSNIHSINKPTENRKVINALGVVSNVLYTGIADSIKLNVADEIIYIEDTSTVEARIFDKYLNPVWENISATITANSGKIKDNTFIPSEGGTTLITAKYKNFSDTKTIQVVDKIQGIYVSSPIVLQKDKSAQLNLMVYDNLGNTALIKNPDNFDIKIENNNIATYKNGKVYANADGTTYLTVRKGNVTANIRITVGNVTSENTQEISIPLNTYNDNQYKKEEGIYTLKFSGVPSKVTSLTDKIVYTKLLNELKNSNIFALLGNMKYPDTHIDTTPYDTSGFSVNSKYGATIITLKAKNQSIRDADYSQWNQLKNAISTSDENIIILCDNEISTTTLEGEVFLKLLNDTNKNVYVITGSDTTQIKRIGNVKIFNLSDTADGVALKDKLTSAVVLTLNISGNDISYYTENIF